VAGGDRGRPVEGSVSCTVTMATAAPGADGVTLQRLATTLDELVRVQRRAHFERLFIAPQYSVPSSGSSRSPRKEERIPLKIATIDYYGLWASTHVKPETRMVYPMLSDSPDDTPPVPVPFKDAQLAHIWPSSQASVADNVGSFLRLRDGFHVEVRNFLILTEDTHVAYDADEILLLPSRGMPPGVRSRLFKIEREHDATKRNELAKYDGKKLYLPRAGDGKVPYMRLLGWKTVSALRALEEDRTAVADLPEELELDVSRDDAGEFPLRRAVADLRRVDVRFSRMR
jgi:hypothetical protein